jgi:CheY-like chemotaxis protein
MEKRKKIGQILVETGVITAKTVERVMTRAQKLGKRVGTLLEEMELITGEELAAALAIQYGCKVVRNLPNQPIQAEILQLVPVGVAMQNMIFPLKREKNLLAMAMADPTDTRIINNIEADNGLKIVPFIATKQDIHAAICLHYLGKKPSTPSAKTVLVVEDDKMIQAMFGNILSKNGYRVEAALDGMEAFKSVIAEKPHVIITDKEMPKLDGYAFLESLKNVPETRSIPVILVTGKILNAEEEAKVFDRGFFDFIPKPVSEVTLLARVKRAFQVYEY